MSLRRVLLVALLLISATFAAAPALADTQAFPNPGFKGHLLDWCLTWGSNCGKAPADAWCKLNGFDEAQSFSEWVNPGIATRLIGTNQVCDEPECDAYTQIVCLGPGAGADQETFNKPKFKSLRLDWCRVWGNDCGQGAANAYCQWKGFDKATAFEEAVNVGLTRILSTGQVCSDPECDSFNYITCQ